MDIIPLKHFENIQIITRLLLPKDPRRPKAVFISFAFLSDDCFNLKPLSSVFGSHCHVQREVLRDNVEDNELRPSVAACLCACVPGLYLAHWVAG